MKTNTLATLLVGFAAGAATVLFCKTEEGRKAREFIKSKLDEFECQKEQKDEE
ncbi:MAG: hypothetical protein IJS62_06010 [Bacteroidales bacterium]|nr:hypothetical protein [Bacteroidales bacterium]